jgi:predicted MFS family arabinose efflux permease
MDRWSFPKLASAWLAAHAADQLLLAWLPLTLVAAAATPATVGWVVAAHSAAWLLVSLPIGAYADRLSRRRIMLAGAATIAGAGLLGLAARMVGPIGPAGLAALSFLAAAGVVAIVLSIFALVPQSVPVAGLARANAGLEFGRACTAILAPFAAAAVVACSSGGATFLALVGGGLVAALAAARLEPDRPREPAAHASLLSSIRDGAAFVAREPLLKAIALCAIAWNSAFFALTAAFAPYAVDRIGLGIPQIAQAWSIYGAGLVLGALAAPIMVARLPAGFMFAFGPAMSAAGVAALAMFGERGSVGLVWFAFFSLGFGPMTWLVLQTSVRQIVTPPELLGRVGAVITTAIYGVRPLGALAASLVAGAYGPAAAMTLAAILFAMSLAAILASPAVRLSGLPLAPSR